MASLFDGLAQGALWALALFLDMAGPYFFGSEGWKLMPAHFAERHGLIVIIALGESIVAIGVGASHELTLAIGTAAVLGVALTAAMWWIYFDVVAIVSGKRLAEAEVGKVQNEMARDSYSYLHLVMVAGIVLVALGLKLTIGHTSAHLHTVPAFALLGGLAVYLLGHVAFRYRHVHTINRRRLLSGDRAADPGPGGHRGAGPGHPGGRQRADLGDDRLRDPHVRRGAAGTAPRPGGREGLAPFSGEAEASRRRRGPSGCSNSCIRPAIAKQRAPVRVPQLAMPVATMSPEEGRTKVATAETMKRTEPIWLTAMIHQPRSRRCQTRQKPPAIPTIARWPEMRKSAQPTMSGDQTRRSKAAGVSSWMNESTRLIAKTSVPAKRTTALDRCRRGSREPGRRRQGRRC